MPEILDVIHRPGDPDHPGNRIPGGHILANCLVYTERNWTEHSAEAQELINERRRVDAYLINLQVAVAAGEVLRTKPSLGVVDRAPALPAGFCGVHTPEFEQLTESNDTVRVCISEIHVDIDRIVDGMPS